MTPEVNPQAARFAENAQALMENHPWMDHQTVATVAQNSPNTQSAVQTGESIGQALRQSWDGFVQVWDDPVLHQQPSPQMAFAQYIHSTLGPPPVQAGTLQQVQQSLADAGVGQGLPVDGVWTQQWQQAWNQQMDTEYRNQSAGQKPGSTKTSSFLQRMLHTFTPSGMGDMFIGWAKDARNLLGDSLAQVANVPEDVRNLFSGNLDKGAAGFAHLAQLPLGAPEFEAMGSGGVSHQAASVGAFINSIGGPEVSADEYEHRMNAMRGLSDALTVLSMTGLGGLGRRTIAKAGEDFARGILPKGAPELQRGPGVIARTVFNANNSGRLLGAKWLANAPGISKLAPLVGRAAGDNSWYYTIRNAGAQVYRLPAVRAAGDLYQGAQTGALALQGMAAVTPGTEFSNNIKNEHVLDAVDANLAAHGPRFFGMSLLDPNNVAFFLHGPWAGSGLASTSRTVGDVVESANNKIIDMLGAKGFPAAVQQALAKGSKIMSRSDMLEAVGGDPNVLNQFIKNLAVQVAHAHYTERQLGHSFTGAAQDEIDASKVAEEKFWKEPGVAAQALKESLEGDPDVQWATNRLKQIFLRNASNPRDAFKRTFEDWVEGTKLAQHAHQMGDTDWYVTPMAHALAGAEHEANRPAPWETEAATYPKNPTMTGELARRILPREPGMFGIAREDYKTRAQVAADAARFENALNAPNADAEAISEQMRQYLYDNASRDARELDVFTPTPDKLLAAIKKWGEGQAGDVTLAVDAPDAVHERFQAIKDASWKLVVGNHIGHVIDGTEPDLGQIEGWTTRRRQFAQRMGLNPSRIRDTDAGRALHLNMLQALIDARRNDPNIQWGSRVTANTLMGLLVRDKAIDGLDLPWYESAVLAGTRHMGVNKSTIDFMKETQGLSQSEAAAKLEASIAYQQSVRDLPFKKIVATLEKAQTVKTRDGEEWQYPGMDHYSATRTAQALMRGYKLPAYMMGWSAMENWARAGIGFGDRIVKRDPTNNLMMRAVKSTIATPLNAAAALPNRIAHVRNQLRFVMNPLFDARRLSKVSYKMGLEGVDPTANPADDLMRSGEATQALRKLNKVIGLTPEEQQIIEADKYARSQSVWSLYAPVWHAAYFVNQKAKEGLSDDELKAAYHRVFSYGTNGGRSALERTMNTIFFPFSFEKTVMRNGMAYLLDHPGQAMITAAAVEEWRRADRNAAIGKWVDAHIPVLAEMNQLNAFAHGISLGQLGGINAQIINPAVASEVAAIKGSPNKSQLLLNLFMPQYWGPNYTKKTLQQYLPVWKEFSQVWQQTTDQGQIGWNLLANMRDDMLQKHTRPRTLIAPSQQLGYALRTKAQMINEAQHIIDFNNSQSSDADKILWPEDPKLPATIQGKPVDRSTIGLYVQSLYPAYSPNSAATAAQKKAAAADAFIAQVGKTDPQMASEMTSFKTVANQVIGKINRDAYTPAQQGQIQAAFRTAAMNLAAKHPQWLTFYNRYYESALGPIEDWTGKGVTQ